MGTVIKNFEKLATNALRDDALSIADAGYAAINTDSAVKSNVQIRGGELYAGNKTYGISGRRVYFVGVGKCAFAAASAIEKLLGDTLAGGVALDVSTDENAGLKLRTIETYTGTHPLPSEKNVLATKRIVEFLSELREEDLAIVFVSGGGSTLLCLPPQTMTCADESNLFKELTAKGATIQDINTVRKHLSHARGGWLAEAAYPAEVISLIVSDIPGNDISFVASGPTMLDQSTVADAQAVLEKYSIAVSNIDFIETPKEQKYFERVNNMLFLSSQDALVAMQTEAARRGYTATIVNDRFTGEAREIGREIAEKLHSAPSKTAFLYAGESTVTLGARHGLGGRNQEMALAALGNIRDDEIILPFASDGHDNTEYAGAIADETTGACARDKNLNIEEYLDDHRAYDFFTLCGNALKTGYTGSNVSDLIIALKK